MVTRSKFYYPAAFHRDAQTTDTLVPWVTALPLQQFVVDPAVILESMVGTQPQGLYAYDGKQWRFGLPMEAISAAIIDGDTMDVYYNLHDTATLPVRAVVYKNGQLQPTDIITPGNAIYVALTPPATGGTGAVSSVNGQIGDVIVNATNLPGLATVGKTGQYADLIGLPAPYALPAATNAALGGVIVPAISNLVIDPLGNIDISPTLISSINAKLSSVVSVGNGIPILDSVVAGTVSLRSAKAGSNITITSDGFGNIVFDSTASGVTTLTGDVTGTGTGTVPTILGPSGVSPGIYTKVTVDVKGRVTLGQNPNTLAGYGITDALSIHGGTVDGTIIMSGAILTGLPLPIIDQDAASKIYVDSTVAASINGVKWRDSVQVATTANITLSGLQTIDGQLVADGDRVLVKNQTAQTENGVYVAAAGAWIRSIDTDTGPEILNMATLVLKGTLFGLTQWTNTNTGAITIGSTSITFAQLQGVGIIYAAGAGLSLTGTTFAITNTGVVAGTYTKVTVNSRGQVTAGSALVLADITTAIGYTPYNGATNPLGFLTTNAPITLTGDATGAGTSSIPVTLANTGVVAGTYTKVTVDAKGRVTVGAQLSNAEITTAIGYTPYNGTTNPNGYIGSSTPIVLTGDVTGSGTPSVPTTLANSGVVAGTYTKVTVDSKGRVTVGAQLSNAEIVAALGFTPVNKAGDTMLGALNNNATVIVAIATPTLIGAAASNDILISSSGTITAFDTVASGATRKVRFGGVVTLTHNASSLELPSNANIITAAGDTAQFTSKGGGNWVCDYYQRDSGQALVASSGSPFATTQVFNGAVNQFAARFVNSVEAVVITAAAPSAVTSILTSLGAVHYYTANAAQNFVVNLSHGAGNTFNALMAVGDSITIALLTKQGPTAFYVTGVQVDGIAVTPNWQGTAAPTTGNINGIDSYTFTVIKTAAATFTVLASQTQFK